MTLRPARPGEAALLTELALRSKAHWGYDDEFMRACRDELTVRPEPIAAGAVTVAELDDVVAGFSTLVDEPPVRELEALFVDPPFIGHGVGGALFDAFRVAAIADGFTRLRIEADPHALGFYEHHGAVVVGEQSSGSIPGRTLPLLELDLTADESVGCKARGVTKEPGLLPTTNLTLKLSLNDVRPGDPLVLTIEGAELDALIRGKLIAIEAERESHWEYVGAVIVQTALGPGGWRPAGERIAMTMEGYFATAPMHFAAPPIPPGSYRIRIDLIARDADDEADVRHRTATLYAQFRVVPSAET